MAGSRRELVKHEANRKGLAAARAGVFTAAAVGILAAVNAAFLITFGVAFAGLAWTGKRTWEWLKYRGQYGLRF